MLQEGQMTPEHRQRLQDVRRVLLEESEPLNTAAVEHELYGVLNVALHYHKGILNHTKTSFEKIRQVTKKSP